MPQVDVSVVIPFFNAAGTLPRCLDALRSQRFPVDRFEVIAVDNNSTDGSADVVRRYPEVVLLREPMQGAYAARNRGVALARGKLLAFTDPDCVPRADWLGSLAGDMQSGDLDLVLGGYVPPSHSAALRLLVLYENAKDAFVFETGIPELYYGHTNNMAVRRSTFDALGPFIERRRGADTIFVRNVVERLGCGVARYNAGALVEHLEVDDVLSYYRKMATYGHSRESYRHIAWTRSLTMRERAAVLRRTIRANELSVGRSLQLVALLAAGLLAWRSGRMRAMLRRFMGASRESAPASSHTTPAADQSTTAP